ncbi:NAD(P)H-quinone oxidoreductase [Ancylobacter pratisalsi]|uniref:NAD(P)H-quinone oxidoreductase n=1 Tax=Ancylobacter pratisalsi TaxID=1745854 RepID=A0A6P1YM57_9HYPH|nr:NAD(P)H-quinone oxidoreductase [Ancylobacter pratisalsi]QIB34517.1 NAD(P)H-quinone oxidoreductase [Ancylobacter pratisalsi]
MKAITFDGFGTADVLRLAEVPMPEPRAGDLLVKVHAAGVNRADLLQRQGYYGRQSYGESDLLGLEVAGEVVAVGADVTGIQPGERVMGIVGGGAYAEFARVDRNMAVRIPEHLDDLEAAAVMESFVTAWEAAVHLGGTASGTAVLIHAAAGGVGSAGVQIGHALGARVFATANAERRADVLALGAEAVFDYRTDDFEQGVRDATGGRGVDVIVDFVGGDYLARNLRSLAPGGRLVQVGLLGGQDSADIPLSVLLHNHLRLIGTVMKSRTVDEKRAMVRRFAEGALPMFANGRLRPLVGKVFPLAQAAEAHHAMEAGGGFGKIVLKVDV